MRAKNVGISNGVVKEPSAPLLHAAFWFVVTAALATTIGRHDRR